MGNWGSFFSRHLVAVFVIVLASQSYGAGKGGRKECKILIGTLNTYNTLPDPTEPDDAKNLKQKIKNMGNALAALNNGKGPDLMALEEMSTQAIQDELVNSTDLSKQGYQTVLVAGQPDYRGIDVGFISRFPLVGSIKKHVYWDPKDPLWNDPKKENSGENVDVTRVILEATVLLPNGENLTIFVNHWASRRGGDFATIRRYMAAKFLQARIDEIFKTQPNANIVAMGDFNTTPWNVEVRAGVVTQAPSIKNINAATPALFSLNQTAVNYARELIDFKKANPKATREEVAAFKKDLNERQGTYYADWLDRWDAFDQMVVSSNMMKKYISGSFKPIKDAPFADKEKHPQPFDPKTGEGVSDHVPVVAGFILDFPKQP